VPDLLTETAAELIGLLEGGLRPVVGDRFLLEEGAEALRQLENRSAQGKIVLALDGGAATAG